jgi:amino acid transporter
MLLIAGAYRGLNRADPDAGTTFAWTTRALGPGMGWVNGWAIFLADVLVMASLAQIAGIYTFKLFGFTELSESTAAIVVAAVVWIAVMTWICYRGIELSARIQQFLLSAEILILSAFAVVTLVKVYSNHPAGSIEPAVAWFNPFAMNFKALVDGVLLGIFIYWGWDSGVAVNEESRNRAEGPGRAAVVSTVILLVIYVIVAAGAQSFHGVAFLANNSSDVLQPLGGGVLGAIGGKLLIIAVLTSASASTQTTILPTARTTLSMARWRAIPEVFGRVHPRYMTPTWSTLGMGALSIVWTICLLAFNPSGNVLGDTISALGFAVCFYYGFTGIACTVYYRRELFSSVRKFVLVGLVPLVGGGMMFAIAVKAYSYYHKAGNNYSKPLLGIQVPIVVGIGGLLVGVVLMLASWPFFSEYFRRRWFERPLDPTVIDRPSPEAPLEPA